MDDPTLLRYSRQILLPQVGAEGQQRLADSRALIIGLGGLGSPAAMYLAAAGVGRLAIADDDRVDLSNLQRQIVHRTHAIGRAKTDSARETLAGLNPLVEIITLSQRLSDAALDEQVAAADVVLDCSDNFATRFAINAACVRQRTPLISGAAIRLEGQIAVFRPERDDSPCYRCLYKDEAELDETCTQTGVLAPLVGIIGSMQAMEAMKVLLDLGETLTGRLLLLDAERMEWRSLRLTKDPQCPVCGSHAAIIAPCL
jgi:adenylyltransferase/sulfurtransferase